MIPRQLLQAGSAALAEWLKSMVPGGPRPALRYAVYAVDPARVEAFLRDPDDAIAAAKLYESASADGFDLSAATLAADIRRMARDHHGCIVVRRDYRAG